MCSRIHPQPIGEVIGEGEAGYLPVTFRRPVIIGPFWFRVACWHSIAMVRGPFSGGQGVLPDEAGVPPGNAVSCRELGLRCGIRGVVGRCSSAARLTRFGGGCSAGGRSDPGTATSGVRLLVRQLMMSKPA